ncbi:Protein LYK5 [Glycine max]|nr:Protein LYK5 [Glycine max]
MMLSLRCFKGKSVSSIVDIFDVDEQSILEANELSATSVIFYFTSISVPLKIEPPVGLQRAVTPSEDSRSPPPPRSAPAEDGDSDSSKKWVIVGIMVGVVVLLILSVALFILCFYQLRQVEHLPPPLPKAFSGSATMEMTISTTHSWSISSEGVCYTIESLSVFKFEELQKATGFFSEENKIKGSVYKASFKGDYAMIEVLNPPHWIGIHLTSLNGLHLLAKSLTADR